MGVQEDQPVGNSASCTQPEQVDALRQEHEELVQLVVHEDSLAWQLNLTFLATNGAIFAGAFGLGLLDATKSPGVETYLLLFVGAVLNISMYFVFQRSKLHRLSRLWRAYQVEDELEQCGVVIKTFSTAERLIFDKKVLDVDGRKTRALRWYETIEVLGWDWWPLMLSALCAAGILWLTNGRAGITSQTEGNPPFSINVHPPAGTVVPRQSDWL